jgi:hypothetical protein
MFIILATTAENDGIGIAQPLMGGDLFEERHACKTVSEALYYWERAVARAQALDAHGSLTYWLKHYRNVLPPTKSYGVRLHGWWADKAVRDMAGQMQPKLRKPRGFDQAQREMRTFIPKSLAMHLQTGGE